MEARRLSLYPGRSGTEALYLSYLFNLRNPDPLTYALSTISGRYLTNYLGTSNKYENRKSPSWSVGKTKLPVVVSQWFPKCGPGNSGGPWDTFEGVCKTKTIFIIKLRCHLPFPLASFLECMMEFSRSYMTYWYHNILNAEADRRI